jgi:hypothetical protein
MVTGAVHWVTVVVFAHVAWGRGRGCSLYAMCVMVAVTGAIIVPCALWLLPLCCMLWWQVQHVGLWLWSLHR